MYTTNTKAPTTIPVHYKYKINVDPLQYITQRKYILTTSSINNEVVMYITRHYKRQYFK